MGWATEMFGSQLMRKSDPVDPEKALKGKKHVLIFYMASF